MSFLERNPMNNADRQYLAVMKNLLTDGVYREGRNGGTYGLFGEQLRFNLSEGLPVLTTKKLFLKGIIHELLWFLRGETNIKSLVDAGVHIWDEWADENGELGPVYGSQWRNWMGEFGVGIDQIADVIERIKTIPNDRRHIVTAWNPAEITDMALPPCHCLFQFHVANGKLSCQLFQRSCDWFLGVPFNIVSYAILTHLVARECGLQVGDFIHTYGDYHLYGNHVVQAQAQLARIGYDKLPVLEIAADAGNIFELKYEDIIISGYQSEPAIAAEVSK